MTFARVRHTVMGSHVGSPSIEDPVGDGGIGGLDGSVKVPMAARNTSFYF